MSKEKLFSFNTPEFSDYNLEVVSFKGSEEIGELYSYEIDLVSKKADIDFDKMLQTEVSLQLHNKDADDIYIHGVLAQFEAHQKIDDHIYYKAYLVPKLWWLSIALNQQIFLDKKIDEIIDSIFKDANFTSDDYELRLQGSYDKKEYICQYKESRYDFLRRWMEREGIYFYFEQDKNGCKVVVTDAKDKHKKLSKMDKLPYRPASGLQDFKQQAVSSIVYRSNNTVKSVRMKNYNYEKPSLDINSATPSSKDDFTQTYLFGNNLSSQDEAKKLSDINTQKYLCLAKEMSGESNIVSLVPGCIYTLSDYFRDDLNSDYLMVRVESEGSQRGFLSTGFADDGDDSSYYQNSFMMIPSDTQFRMQTSTLWPHIGGMISATIDGQGSGDTAEIDKDGRYKVIMPFDVSGRKEAKASAYMRMAQPSAGEKQGMHFPLHKGTEVLIAFKGGDPDQPIITGAVPNINNPSPVNDENATKSVIQTHGGNIIHMEDTPGKAHIKMAVHDDISSVTIHNNDDEEEDGGYWGLKFETEGGSKTFVKGNTLETRLGTKEEFSLAEVLEVFVGAKQELKLAELLEVTIGLKQELKLAGVLDINFSLSTGLNVGNKLEYTFGGVEEVTAGLIVGIKLGGGVELSAGPIEVISPEATKIHEMETQINNLSLGIAEAVTRIDNSQIEAHNDLMRISEAIIDGVEEEIRAVSTKIEANETKISEAETQLKHSSVLLEDYTSKLTDAEMEVIACELSLIQ